MDNIYGFGELLGHEDQPAENHEAIALGTDIPARWRLAGRDDLSRRVIEILAHDADEHVLESLATNLSTPTDILAALAQRRPEPGRLISTHQNAPASLKRTVSILEHSSFSIVQFMDDEAATGEERQALAKEFDRLSGQQLRRHRKGEIVDPSTGPLLGDAWATIRPIQKSSLLINPRRR